MFGTVFLRNGRLEPADGALFGLDDHDLVHGYGCYETLKLREGFLYFAEFHEERLLKSLGILGIAHCLEPGAVVAGIRTLVDANRIAEANIKVLAVGRERGPADWYAFLTPPVAPPEGARQDGVSCLLFRGQRQFPQADRKSVV